MSPLQQQVAAEFQRGQRKTQWMNALKGPLAVPEVKKIEEVCSLIWERKGKKLRSQWVFWFGEELGISYETLNLYAWAVEAIHTATLLHDDVIDKAPRRRGGASANAVFDNTLPVLSGDYLLSDAIFQLSDKGHPLLVKLMCLAVKEVTQGEVLQYESQYQLPETQNYFEMLNRLKTSALLKWAAQVGSILKYQKEDPTITQLARQYGALYQFTDDLLDLRGSPTKASWQDLREGKINEVTYLLLEQESFLRKELKRDLERKDIPADLLLRIQETAKRKNFQTFMDQELLRRQERCLS
ncbi:hypothetical protein EBQ90_11745, partial [bacterium]|nr:hypothetical protein [bacterium]